MNIETEAEIIQYLEQVRSYYDQMNPLILKYVGKTYQASLIRTDSEADLYHETNLYLATQAGIQPRHHVLDAGCGNCGPSIDIAQAIEGVKINAITLSPSQAETAREFVRQAGLADRIQIHIGDFHDLPFADETFDVVFFFESAVYSYDQQKLFAEAYRVLRPGGNLYIKNPFRQEHTLSEEEQKELAESDRIYACKISRISETLEAISVAGFQNIHSRDLSEILCYEEFAKAMLKFKYGFPLLTEFGKFHYYKFKCLPAFFGEIKAYKPSDLLVNTN